MTMAIEDDESWVVNIQKKLEGMNPLAEAEAEAELWRKQSIYRVPTCIKDLNRKAYSPQVVSFGPYHHGAYELGPMEEHKHRALFHFLKRADKPFAEFVMAMEEIVQQLQDSYQSLDDMWRADKGRFLKLMIVDGCFMLEVLRVAVGSTKDYAYNDYIFSAHGMVHTLPYIKRDMLMVENQLPLLVLAKLVAVERGESMNENEELINTLVLMFCAPTAQLRIQGMGLGLHPLDLLRKSMLIDCPPSSSRPFSGRWSELTDTIILRSAVELYEAGIRVERSKTESLTDISFHGAVLQLPVIVVDDTTEYLFLNLMAFERLHVGAGNEVSYYIFFMDSLLRSTEDVSLLNSKCIIYNMIGSDKSIIRLFNSLSKDLTLDPDCSLDEVYRRVSHYCNKRWNMWRAKLIHTYGFLRTPGGFLSLLTTIFLLILTVIQTVYTVYPNYRHGQARVQGAP